MKILSDEFDAELAGKLKITNLNLDVYENVSIQHFYYTLYIKSKKELIRLSEIVDKVYQEKYNYYKFEYDKTLKGSEIEIWIRNNEQFKEQNRILQLKKLEVERLEGAVKAFQDRGWAISHAIKLLELEKR